MAGREPAAGAHHDAPSYIVFRLDALGDVVLTTPLFRALKLSRPKSRLTVVVQAQYKSLLATNPHIDEILPLPQARPLWLPKRLQRLIAAILLYGTQLRARHFDYAISPRWDVDEHLATFLCALTPATHRVGFSSSTSEAKQRINRGFDSVYDMCLPPGPACHESLRNLAVAKAVGATSQDDRPEILLSERDRGSAIRLLGDMRPRTTVVALGIGAQSEGRRWPLARFAETVNQIGESRELHPVVVCSKDEFGEALKLSAQLRKAPTILHGATLREVCAVLERCDIFLGNDSGCAHLASAVGCNLIVISRHPKDGDANHFNSPIRIAPRGRNVRVLQPATGRDRCSTGCIVTGQHCILGVSVEDVVGAALQMLDSRRSAIPEAPKPGTVLLPARLLEAHSADAVRHLVEVLRNRVDRPIL
jgi:ADP-heptose:LPS heptosyltransferase